MESKYIFLVIFSTILIAKSISEEENRTIIFEFNPYCIDSDLEPFGKSCDDPFLTYGKGTSPNNTIHYLWGFVGLPSLIMVTTSPETDIKIDYAEIAQKKSGAISFSDAPRNVIAISLQNLILFNDENDTGRIDNMPPENMKNISFSEFEWITVDSEDNLTCTFQTSKWNGEDMKNNSFISIAITAFEESGRSDEVPRLLMNPNLVQMDLILSDLLLNISDSAETKKGKASVVPISGFEYPRWAIDMVVVSYDSDSKYEDNLIYSAEKSLDDEYTPGVFDLVSVTSKRARGISTNSDHGGFLQWRPVCYLDREDIDNINYSTYPNIQVNDTTDALNKMDKTHQEQAKNSLLYSLFGPHAADNTATGQTIVSFGLTGDKFYTEYDYTKWTLSMGMGSVPEESFSSVVIIVISVGVGVPIIIFILSAVYFGIKKYKKKQDDTTALL